MITCSEVLRAGIIFPGNRLIGMRFLLAAVVLLLQGPIGRALPASFGALHSQVEAPLQRQRTVSDATGVTLRGQA